MRNSPKCRVLFGERSVSQEGQPLLCPKYQVSLRGAVVSKWKDSIRSSALKLGRAKGPKSGLEEKRQPSSNDIGCTEAIKNRIFGDHEDCCCVKTLNAQPRFGLALPRRQQSKPESGSSTLALAFCVKEGAE
jgi:hypothetical protein